MRTLNLSLLTFLLLILASCMPDSFTNFKEEPPSKTSASGGSSGSSSPPSPVPNTNSDVQYDIKSAQFYQSRNDTYMFEVKNGVGFSVGDVVHVSSDILSGSGIELGTVVQVNALDEESDVRVLGVQLDGGTIVDFDGNSTYDSDLLIEPNDTHYVANGYYLDNCVTGYGTCAVGASSVTQIQSDPILFISPDTPPVSGGLNLDKRIKITQSSGAFNSDSADFDYEIVGSPLGLGVNEATDDDATDDRLESPFGPFTTEKTFDFSTTPLTIKVSLNKDFYGTGLDPEEQATATILATSSYPGTPVEDSAIYNLSYYHEDGDRFMIRVENISGFTAGEVIRACRFNISSACDADDDSPAIDGKATIEMVDATNNSLLLSANNFDHDNNGTTTDRKSLFKNGAFIHNQAGTVVTTQSSIAYRIFRDTLSPAATLYADFNVQNDSSDDPSNDGITVSYQISEIPNGVTFLSDGRIEIENPSLLIDKEITITAKNSATGDVLDTFVMSLNFIGTPTGLTFDNGATTRTFKGNIDVTNETFSLNVVKDINSSLLINEDENLDLGKFKFEVDTALPTGISLNQNTGDISFSPEAYSDGTTPYTIRAFHPAFNAGTAPGDAFASVVAYFKTATFIETAYFSQQQDDRLILEVSSTSGFSSGSTVNLSNEDGGQGVITAIDSGANLLFVQIPSGTTLQGPQVFKQGDKLDSTATFVTERATINSVTHVYDVTDPNNRLLTTTGIIPVLYSGGTTVTLATGETINWAISPSLPSDLSFNATNDGRIESSSASNDNNLASMPATTYNLVAVNEIGDTASLFYRFVINEAPDDVSVGRYQFIRLSGNGHKFHVGTRISINSSSSSGRVLMPIDIEGDGINEGLLVEFGGDIPDNAGIDNVGTFVAQEATVKPYVFIYLKDPMGIAKGDTLTTANGDEVLVEEAPVGSRIYAEVKLGSIEPGETLFKGTTTYSANNVEDRHYITGIIEVDTSGTLDALEVGGYISSDNFNDAADDSKALVVHKHYDAANGKYYALIQHISGPFREGDHIDNAETFATSIGSILSVVGPNINIYLNPSATISTPISASGKGSGSGGNKPFWEGSLIAGWQDDGAKNNSSGPSTPTSAGFAVAGTDYDNQLIVVNVENYKSHFRHFRTSSADTFYLGYIDDFSEFVSDMDDPNHNEIDNIQLSNLIIGYTDEGLHIEPIVKGEFSSISLTPEALPTGLSFDSQTGRISGTPTEPAGLQNYTITFRAADGSSFSSYTFPLVVYNQFNLSAFTAGASSYVLHREGQGLGTSRCRVIGPQINDDVTDSSLYNQAIYGTNDVICFLEAAESDLFNVGLNFNITSGAGMCEYVRYTPYAYTTKPLGETTGPFINYKAFKDAPNCIGTAAITVTGSAVSDGYVVPSDLRASGIPITGRSFDRSYCDAGNSVCRTGALATPGCFYDYSLVDGAYPNTDSGSYDLVNISCTYTESDANGDDIITEDEKICACETENPQVVDCGGTFENAVRGPVRDLYPTLEGASTLVNSFSGISSTYEISSGISFTPDEDSTYAANYLALGNYGTGANACMRGVHNFDTYSSSGNLSEGRAGWDQFFSNGSPYSTGSQTFYTFDCLDAGFDRKARIRVMVRDWDREFTPDDPELERMLPETTGSRMDDETSTCFGVNCNASFDLDNYISTFSSTSTIFETASCGDDDGTIEASDAAALVANYTTSLGTLSFTRGSRDVTVTSGPSDTVLIPGATIVIDPGGLNLVAQISNLTSSAGVITGFKIDKIMISTDSGLTYAVKRTVPLPPTYEN